MQHTKNPYVRALIHLFLIGWTIYSVTPFVMSIITSLQLTRDATARRPKFLAQEILDNNVLIAVVLFLLVLAAYWLYERFRGLDEVENPERQSWTSRYGAVLIAAGVIAVGFVLLTNSVAERHVYSSTFQNYQKLWLTATPEEFAPYGIGLIGLTIVLLIVAFNVKRIAYGQTYVYFTIVAIIVATIVILPSLVKFAEFYDYFLNSVIVTVGTVAISISIGCLAGYGLARYAGIAGVAILFAALAFRALPRMAFILPYYYFAQVTGLYDTYALLIITFVAINQPFTIWMLRSFFMEVPREIEEAAMIDGCNRLTGFIRVIVPISWPGIITTSLFTLLLAYNEFLLARLLTSSLWTLPVGISRFTSGEDIRLITLSNASAVSITLPIVVLIIFFQRNLVKGLAGGAVKG